MRGHVRLIKAAAVRIELEEHDESRVKLEVVRRRYQKALRQLVETLPPHVTAKIMAASEKVLGTVRNVGKN